MDRASLQELLGEITAAQERARQRFERAKEATRALEEAVAVVDKSWSRGWFGYHSHLYYCEFEEPSWQRTFNPSWGSRHGIPEGWETRTAEDVFGVIEQRSGTSIVNLRSLTEGAAVVPKKLRDETCILLAPLRGRPGFEKEEQLLDELEELSWELDVATASRMRMPERLETRDTVAAGQGIRTPPHYQYEGKVVAAIYPVLQAEKFFEQATRLVRQVLQKVERPPVPVPVAAPAGLPPTHSATEIVLALCGRFGHAARQLEQHRKAGEQFTVRDEYDVQDLMHAFLKLRFDDVRPEEWTPSFAGAHARMDFLLKKEKIVIEAKISRAARGTKELSDELIIDIARYESHPDCETLVCFVYDPERRLKNPAALLDLEQTGKLRVRVVVGH